jgi:hypothetical protein
MTDFDDGRVDLLEFSESGDEIATKLKFTGTGHRSGIETSLVWGALWRFRNGLIVEVNGYPSYEEALERLSG